MISDNHIGFAVLSALSIDLPLLYFSVPRYTNIVNDKRLIFFDFYPPFVRSSSEVRRFIVNFFPSNSGQRRGRFRVQPDHPQALTGRGFLRFPQNRGIGAHPKRRPDGQFLIYSETVPGRRCLLTMKISEIGKFRRYYAFVERKIKANIR